MRIMRRLGLVVLVVAGAVLLASTPMHAKPKSGGILGSDQLTNAGDEPRASGEMVLSEVICLGERSAGWYMVAQSYTATLTVKCSKLTPGATYWTPAGTFTADRMGKGAATGAVEFELVYYVDQWGSALAVPYVVDVIRLDADGSETTVLRGEWGYPHLMNWWW